MFEHECIALDESALRAWPLPQLDAAADKEARGRVLVIAGSDEMPGAALLAATASLRAGAGKLAMACPASIAPAVALRMPEARVIGLSQDVDGALLPAYGALIPVLRGATAVLIGPGMQPQQGVVALMAELMRYLEPDAALILDAGGMDVVLGKQSWSPPRLRGIVFTPHAGEMAHLLERDKNEVMEDPAIVAKRASQQWRAVVALKGAVTHVAAPDGRCWRHAASTPGLATSGSGDVLAGLIAGLAARGAAVEQAAAWGIALHAAAGHRLALRQGPLGYLARELAGEVPGLMAAWEDVSG